MPERRRGLNAEGTERLCVQFAFFKMNSQWPSLAPEAREEARRAFVEAVRSDAAALRTFSYSTLGLRADTDFFLWRTATGVEPLQEGLSRLLRTPFGRYTLVTNLLFGIFRPSVYTKRPLVQQEVSRESERARYLVVYPFVKTIEWYLLGEDERQSMMNEHIRVGRSYPSVKQLLAYSTGLADQEFIVAYETNDLGKFQDLVIALRSTEVRRYTLRDTPIFTGVLRPLEEALKLVS